VLCATDTSFCGKSSSFTDAVESEATSICNALNSGASASQVEEALLTAPQSALSPTQLGEVLGASVGVQCPQYTSDFTSGGTLS
jgi:hypothetical protein